MFCFYEDRSFKILTCTPRLVEPSQPEASALPPDVLRQCARATHMNFMDPDMMQAIGCFLQWMIFTGGAKNQKDDIHKFDHPEWLQQTLSQVSRGKSGRVAAGVGLKDRLPVVVKTALDKSGLADFLHEFLVAQYATNRLRALLPNFCFSFALYESIRVARLAMENVPGPKFSLFCRSLLDKPATPQHSDRFLRVLMQLVLSLEVAQESHFFTHYDLHTENVLIRTLSENLPFVEYPILDRVYRFESVSEVPVLIDFAHASVRYGKGFLGKIGPMSFPQYGMFPFYIPGADLFKLFSTLWLNLFMIPRFARDTMGERLQLFVFHVLLKFFRVRILNHPVAPPEKAPGTTFTNKKIFPDAEKGALLRTTKDVMDAARVLFDFEGSHGDFSRVRLSQNQKQRIVDYLARRDRIAAPVLDTQKRWPSVLALLRQELVINYRRVKKTADPAWEEAVEVAKKIHATETASREETEVVDMEARKVYESFANGTGLKTIYLSPLDFIHFLENDPQIRTIFNCTSFPWSSKPRKTSWKTSSILTYRKQRTYRCIEKLFCSRIRPMPRAVYPFTTRHASLNVDPESLLSIITKKAPPALDPSNRKQIDEFLSPGKTWAAFTRLVEDYMTQSLESAQIPEFFKRHKTVMMYYYRVYLTLQGYRSFLQKNTCPSSSSKKNDD